MVSEKRCLVAKTGVGGIMGCKWGALRQTGVLGLKRDVRGIMGCLGANGVL